jgi:hypothetical protein
MDMCGDNLNTCAPCSFVSGSWTRCSIVSPNIAPNYFLFGNATLWNGGITRSANDVLVWGAQCEAGAYATSYIPTVAAGVTRSAEAPYFTMPSAPNATGVYSMAGTVTTPRVAAQNWAVAVQNTAGAQPYRALYNSGTFQSDTFNGSAIQASRAGLGQLSVKRAVSYNDGTSQYGIYDGATFGPTVGTRTAPAATLLHVGNSFAAGFELDGIVTRVCLDGDSSRCR